MAGGPLLVSLPGYNIYTLLSIWVSFYICFGTKPHLLSQEHFHFSYIFSLPNVSNNHTHPPALMKVLPKYFPFSMTHFGFFLGMIFFFFLMAWFSSGIWREIWCALPLITAAFKIMMPLEHKGLTLQSLESFDLCFWDNSGDFLCVPFVGFDVGTWNGLLVLIVCKFLVFLVCLEVGLWILMCQLVCFWCMWYYTMRTVWFDFRLAKWRDFENAGMGLCGFYYVHFTWNAATSRSRVMVKT